MLAASASVTVGASGSIQLGTLNSLAGQSVSYAPAGSLPSHFTLSPASAQLVVCSVGTYSVAFTQTTPAPRPAPPPPRR